MIPFEEGIFYLFLGCAGYVLLRVLIKSLVLILHKQPDQSDSLPPITIVIAARNEAEHLPKLVPALMEQDYPDFEVRIALDRCSDESLDIMKQFEDQYSNLQTMIIDELPDQFSPKKFALTLGIKGAKNEWILLTDADCLPSSKQWIREMASSMNEQNDFVLGYSPYQEASSTLNHYIRYETFLTAYAYLSSAKLKNPYMGVGRNLAFRKSLFLNLKGYNQFQGLMGGDDDLFVQHHADPKRTAICIGSEGLTSSPAKQNRKDYWKQKKRHFSVSKFYLTKSKLSHSVNSLLQISLWVSFIILAIQNHQMMVVLPVFIGLMLTKGILYWQAARKMGQGFDYRWLLFLEMAYVLFVPIAAITSTFSKKVTWK